METIFKWGKRLQWAIVVLQVVILIAYPSWFKVANVVVCLGLALLPFDFFNRR